MSAWTTQQEHTLEAMCCFGARAARDEIAKMHGVTRSIAATERHGQRMGLSFRRILICPECGREFIALNRQTGLCKLCSRKMQREQAQERYHKALANTKQDGTGNDYDAINRKYNSLRKAAQRAENHR